MRSCSVAAVYSAKWNYDDLGESCGGVVVVVVWWCGGVVVWWCGGVVV